jgi:hypothetical protein
MLNIHAVLPLERKGQAMVPPGPTNRAYSDWDTRWLRGRWNHNVFASRHVPVSGVMY